MTNTNDATLPTHSILEECTAMAVVNALKIILKNSYAIYLKTKMPLGRPYFRDFHLLLALSLTASARP
jgi:hypothetical protein